MSAIIDALSSQFAQGVGFTLTVLTSILGVCSFWRGRRSKLFIRKHFIGIADKLELDDFSTEYIHKGITGQSVCMTAFLVENRTNFVVSSELFADPLYVKCDSLNPVIFDAIQQSKQNAKNNRLVQTEFGFSIEDFRLDPGQWMIFGFLHEGNERFDLQGTPKHSTLLANKRGTMRFSDFLIFFGILFGALLSGYFALDQYFGEGTGLYLFVVAAVIGFPLIVFPEFVRRRLDPGGDALAHFVRRCYVAQRGSGMLPVSYPWDSENRIKR